MRRVKEMTTEEKIIHAGRQLFSQHGYSATSMSDIADKVSITKSSLYYFFEGKQSLYIQIMLVLIGRVGDVYRTDKSSLTRQDCEAAILQTIEICEEYGSMLQDIDYTKFDIKTKEFKNIVERKKEMTILMESFFGACGVKYCETSALVLNSSIYGYMQQKKYKEHDITPAVFSSQLASILIG